MSLLLALLLLPLPLFAQSGGSLEAAAGGARDAAFDGSAAPRGSARGEDGPSLGRPPSARHRAPRAAPLAASGPATGTPERTGGQWGVLAAGVAGFAAVFFPGYFLGGWEIGVALLGGLAGFIGAILIAALIAWLATRKDGDPF